MYFFDTYRWYWPPANSVTTSARTPLAGSAAAFSISPILACRALKASAGVMPGVTAAVTSSVTTLIDCRTLSSRPLQAISSAAVLAWKPSRR